MNTIIRIIFSTALLLGMPPLAGATQGHGAGEGLFVHQLSHLFFCFSMGILIYWLRARRLTSEPGWRYIGYAAAMFLLWSLDAFTAHLLDEQLSIVHTHRIGTWDIQLETHGFDSRFAVFYYYAKLDHLFCAPAMIFFYFGLRRLSIRAVADREDAAIGETAG